VTAATTAATARRRSAARQSWLDRPLTSYHLVVGSAGLLLALGLVMVLSASSVQSYAATGSSFTIASRQLVGVGLGLPSLWVASRLPVRAYRWLGYPLLLASIALLLLVLVPGVGVGANGATRWIPAGPIQIQPSEVAKLALVLWGADLLARKERRLGEVRHLIVPLVPVTMLFAALIMLEPDMGTTVVLLTVMLGLLWTVGAPMRIFGFTFAGLGSGLALLAVTEPYRLARLTSFLNPFKDAQGAGYQAVQGLYALASGGWWGLGLGASREKWAYLPNQYTDYIFAIIGEELGLVGTFAVVALFGVLGYAGLRIARRSVDPFVRLASAGVTAWLLGQALVNMGYVVGLLPVTGVPLPLVSFGGSALVPTLFAVGMLASFARQEPGAAEAIANRRAARGGGLWARLVARSR
jgi:cell division protein FtsW